MAANDTTVLGNFSDVVKFQLKDGSAITRIAATLAEKDDFIFYTPSIAANAGLTHHELIQTSLPTGYLVDIGGSHKESKGEFTPITESLCTIRSSYSVPRDVMRNCSKQVGMSRLNAEKAGHMMAITQGMTNIMLNGPTTPNQSGIVGILQRPPYTTYDYKFTWSAGGTGDDKRNALLIKPGIDTVFRLHNKFHPTMGVESEEMPMTKETGLGTNSDEHRWMLNYEFELQGGLCIYDQRAFKLICNIDAGPTDFPGEDLVRCIFNAASINRPKGGTLQRYNQSGQVVEETDSPWILFVDDRTKSKLRDSINNKILVSQSTQNVFKRKVWMLDDIIIADMDALGYQTVGSGASAISAAS